MEYGILTAEDEWGEYQIIGAVDSPDEARELAQNYFDNGPDSGLLAPDRFVIHRRNSDGYYMRCEPFEL